MASRINPAKVLMGSFKELGLSASQVRHFLPAWWDDEAGNDDGGLLELKILLARRLNVTLSSLQDAVPKPAFGEVAKRFKTVHPDGSSQLSVAAGVGHGLAQILVAACKMEVDSTPISAGALRRQLLKQGGVVTLEALCRWSWSRGVPVVHITNWPKNLRRPDAMCLRVGDRPVVLVVRKEVVPARLTYLVAHEIGHVMSGHLGTDANAVLVDETLPVDGQLSASDEDEQVADAFAMELLGGMALKNACLSLRRDYTDEVRLAVDALSVARSSQLDAAQIVLGWARLNSNWTTAGLAMRYLMTTQAANHVINDLACKALNHEALGADALEHLTSLAGINFEAP